MMRRPALLAAGAITALLALYIALVAQRAWALLFSDSWVGKTLGVAFMVLPVVAVWFLIHEWRLGMAVQRMRDSQVAQGAIPVPAEGEHAVRFTEDQAAALFEAARLDVDLTPERWDAWYRLGYAYDAMGDKSQARQALRYAAELFRKS